MAFMAKDKIVRTGTDLNLATLVNLQADATALGLLADDQVALSALADTEISTDQTGVAMVEANRLVKVVKVDLAAVDTGGGVFSWVNPESVSILVTRVTLDVTTQSTSACTVDIGTTAANGTTPSDNLIDGRSVATVGVYDNMLAATQGTNGKTAQKLDSGDWVTGSKATGASAGLAGHAYIYYILV